jgi:hypothetical protein
VDEQKEERNIDTYYINNCDLRRHLGDQDSRKYFLKKRNMH